MQKIKVGYRLLGRGILSAFIWTEMEVVREEVLYLLFVGGSFSNFVTLLNFLWN